MAKRYKITDISSLSHKPVFFDANVILFIFWPTGSQKWENSYSTVFGNLIKMKNRMIVDFNVISEVVNRAVRIEYEKHLQMNGIDRNGLSFKDYRNSPDGQSALQDIYQIIDKKILSIFDVEGKSFTKSDIIGFLKTDKLDFNDKGIESICKENGFILITNDKDFAVSDIEILSTNPVLLRAS